ncbi:MAG: FKBP-type peptidyl-prolyl cis-trans isomerase [Bacteroidia bacterium]
MNISNEKVVSLWYELHLNDEKGELVEKVEPENPFTFLYGAGNLVPKFEDELKGLKEGDAFDFPLNSDEAYGPVKEEAIVDLPREIFSLDGKQPEEVIKEGDVVPMQDEAGNKLQGRVLELGESIKMDFNHPLAGQDLYFKGKVLEVREASQEELEHKHAHGPGGHKE